MTTPVHILLEMGPHLLCVLVLGGDDNTTYTSSRVPLQKCLCIMSEHSVLDCFSDKLVCASLMEGLYGRTDTFSYLLFDVVLDLGVALSRL